jgi:pimeloyl-ACP methyl ester carboxylesterase
MVLGFLTLISIPASVSAQIWISLTPDAKGDGRDPLLPDAAMLAYRYDRQQDLIWFRIALYGGMNSNAFGVNLVFDTDTGGEKVSWWGGNKSFRFDKLLTAWVVRANDGYSGTIGVGDAAGVKAKQFTNLQQNNLQIRVDGDQILIGVKRTDITDKMKMKLIAAVGSNERWNDDVPGSSSVTIDLSAARPTQGLREIDTGRNNFQFPPDWKTLPESKPAAVIKQGRGSQTLILIPGVYSGRSSFDSFIARNKSRYTFYIVTPPGINGTSPRPMPIGLKLAARAWTRMLERDILHLIRTKKLIRPVIVTDSHPGSTAAIDLAVENSLEVGGVVIAGTNLVQFLPSPKDPTRRTSISASDRVEFVEDAWASQWFKYVTPETWLSNDMRPEMLSSDIQRSQKAVEEIEQAALEVKIRYLCEFWASDVTTTFDKLEVPVLALVPGFDDKYLADPANLFTKFAYVDLWESVIPKNPNVEIVKVPNARLLVLDDQPERSDELIRRFMNRLREK